MAGAAGPPQPDQDATVPVGVDRAADVMLAWQLSSAAGSGPGETDVWAQWRPAGGPFQAPVRVFAATGYATFTSALDPRGDAVIAVAGKPLVGATSDMSMSVITRAPRGPFSAPHEVSDPTEYVASYLYPAWLGLDGLAIDDRGGVALAWEARPTALPGRSSRSRTRHCGSASRSSSTACGSRRRRSGKARRAASLRSWDPRRQSTPAGDPRPAGSVLGRSRRQCRRWLPAAGRSVRADRDDPGEGGGPCDQHRVRLARQRGGVGNR